MSIQHLLHVGNNTESTSKHDSDEAKNPLQDIGIIVNTCLPMPPSYKGNLRVSLLLRQSIEELYLSTTVLTGVVAPSSHDEPLCLPDFPRFSFCSWKKGELIMKNQ
ncbi:lymphocyte antigen 86 isoform X1 [Oncorhynchus kisutch]|uniref:lymphocyte antigen 86 isoform X1 n=1 Tax=Oncorhynchus kisutch TaxID=8019 RepID=UPI0012DF2988|nr:lymphocyte antigen 86 isoform X1 [Oncorhynchus kisutch]